MKNVSQSLKRKEAGGVKRLQTRSIWGINKDIKTRSMTDREARVNKTGLYRPSNKALNEIRPFPKKTETTVPAAV